MTSDSYTVIPSLFGASPLQLGEVEPTRFAYQTPSCHYYNDIFSPPPVAPEYASDSSHTGDSIHHESMNQAPLVPVSTNPATSISKPPSTPYDNNSAAEAESESSAPQTPALTGTNPNLTPKKRRKEGATSAQERRTNAYAAIYEKLCHQWEHATEAELQDYLRRLSKDSQCAVLDKLDAFMHEDENKARRVGVIMACKKVSRLLPAPGATSPAKRAKCDPDNGPAYAAPSAAASPAAPAASCRHHPIPILCSPNSRSTSSNMDVPGAGAGLTLMPMSNYTPRQLPPDAAAPAAQADNAMLTLSIAHSTSRCHLGLDFILDDNLDSLIEFGSERMYIRDVVRQLLRLEEYENPTEPLPEFPVLARAEALQLRASLQSSRTGHLESTQCVIARGLILVCIGIVEQDHLRDFPNALDFFKQAYECVTSLENKDYGPPEFRSLLSEPLCQALFSRIEARLGSSYRVNQQYDLALKYTQLAYNRASTHFQGITTFRSLRASIAALLCTAHRWSHLPDSLRHAAEYARESLALYEGLHEPGALQWATSELVKVYYALDEPEKVEHLRVQLRKPLPGESASCCAMRGHRLAYEGQKECYMQALRRFSNDSHAIMPPPLSATAAVASTDSLAPAASSSSLSLLLLDAQHSLSSALSLAETAVTHSSPQCRCARQVEALRKCRLWIENQAKEAPMAARGSRPSSRDNTH